MTKTEARIAILAIDAGIASSGIPLRPARELMDKLIPLAEIGLDADSPPIGQREVNLRIVEEMLRDLKT